MLIATQLSHAKSDPELLVGFVAVTGLVVVSVWALMKRVLKQPVQPDPWDQKVAAEIGSEEATPLCHRCLTAHDSSTDFCPACGAAVGQYTNWLPYPQLFSIGHALRIGTSGEFRRSPLTVSFFLLFSLVEYTLFAPIYWIFMALKLGKHREHDQPHDRSSTASSEATS
jgi:hypothetical protein